MLRCAQALPSYIKTTAYEKYDISFMKTVSAVLISQVHRDVNVIYRHVLYKAELLDDGTKLIKT